MQNREYLEAGLTRSLRSTRKARVAALMQQSVAMVARSREQDAKRESELKAMEL